jgi:DnaK suppressor protein
MRKREREKYRSKLEEMRKDILREIEDEMKEGQDNEAGEGRDTYDIASDERDREIALLLDDRERKKLLLIDDAIARIEDGDYGICEECEGEIAGGRLEAMPFSRLCVTCQDEFERAQRTMQTESVGTFTAGRVNASADFDDDSM